MLTAAQAAEAQCMQCGADKAQRTLHRLVSRESWSPTLQRWMPALVSRDVLLCTRCLGNLVE